MTVSTYSTKNKKFDNFTVTDNLGNIYLFVRSSKGFFNIAKCEINTDGLIPNAVWYSDEEVAELVAQHEEHNERLAKAKKSLTEYVNFRNAWSRKGKRKLKLQKQEAV
jgi:hypothetical protein